MQSSYKKNRIPFSSYLLPFITIFTLSPSFSSAVPKVAEDPCFERLIQGMSCIPGGTFIRGSEQARTCLQGEVKRIPPNQPNHRPSSKVDVSTFYMDLTEVTYGDYQTCVRSKRCPPRKPQYADYNVPRQPMVGVSWYDAYQYCKAQGKHLPTEAEWEKAARGTEGERYPWGNEDVTCERAVIKDHSGRSCGVKKARGKYPEKGKVLPVMSRPAGRYGLYDMIGNAEEWTADWYSRDWESCGEDCSKRDPQGPCSSQSPDQPCAKHRKKVVRGGSWYWPSACATSWTRRPHFPANKPYHHFGFRCAATLKEASSLLSIQSR